MGHSGEKSACGALFVYGTLIERDFRERLLGRAVAAIDARLPGFERGRTRHFYIVPRPGAVTKGMILLDMTSNDFAILDVYEEVPILYTRKRVEVIGADGQTIRCWVYLPTGWAQPRGGTET